MKRLWTSSRLAFVAVLTVAACLTVGCKKDTAPSTRDLLLGKWSLMSSGNEVCATNDRIVVSFADDGSGVCVHPAINLPDGSALGFISKDECKYSLDGNMLSMTIDDWGCFSHITSIDQRTMSLTVDSMGFLGTCLPSSISCSFARVNNNFEQAIIGSWNVVGMTDNPLYDAASYRFDFNADGTYAFFELNDNGEWVAPSDLSQTYSVNGNWLSTFWVLSDGTPSFECWDIDKIQGDKMYWSAVRKDAQGNITMPSMTLQRL